MISNVAIEITEIKILNKTRVDFLVIGIMFLNNIASTLNFSKTIQSTIYNIWAWTMIVGIPCLLSVLITYEFTNAIE